MSDVSMSVYNGLRQSLANYIEWQMSIIEELKERKPIPKHMLRRHKSILLSMISDAINHDVEDWLSGGFASYPRLKEIIEGPGLQEFYNDLLDRLND